MSDGERLQDAAVQRGLESAGDRITGHQAALLLGVFGKRNPWRNGWAADGRVHGGEGPAHVASLSDLRAADDRRDLLVLQDDGEGQILGAESLDTGLIRH